MRSLTSHDRPDHQHQPAAERRPVGFSRQLRPRGGLPMSDFNPPAKGFIFWPVGCGDSTTVVLAADTILQIDLPLGGDAEKDDNPRRPIVDELVDLLPKRDGTPYLSAFGATHLDKDHICGFGELL